MNPIINSSDIEKLRKYFEYNPKKHIHEFISKETIFFNIEISNKEELLSFIYNEISKYEDIHDNKYDFIKREELAESEIEPTYASPVIFLNSGYSKIFVIILKRPILWNSRMVRIIFIIASVIEDGDNTSYLYDAFESAIQDKRALEEILRAKNENDVLKILHWF